MQLCICVFMHAGYTTNLRKHSPPITAWPPVTTPITRLVVNSKVAATPSCHIRFYCVCTWYAIGDE